MMTKNEMFTALDSLTRIYLTSAIEMADKVEESELLRKVNQTTARHSVSCAVGIVNSAYTLGLISTEDFMMCLHTLTHSDIGRN